MEIISAPIPLERLVHTVHACFTPELRHGYFRPYGVAVSIRKHGA